MARDKQSSVEKAVGDFFRTITGGKDKEQRNNENIRKNRQRRQQKRNK